MAFSSRISRRRALGWPCSMLLLRLLFFLIVNLNAARHGRHGRCRDGQRRGRGLRFRGQPAGDRPQRAPPAGRSLPPPVQGADVGSAGVTLLRKMVPQNIMYDRRVVRGNTFGASVIPVGKLARPHPQPWSPTPPRNKNSCATSSPASAVPNFCAVSENKRTYRKLSWKKNSATATSRS